LSHLTADFGPEQVTAAAQAYSALAPVPVIPRTHAQVTGLLGGLPLVPPGVVRVSEWRPAHTGEFTQPADLYAGLATIPRDRRWPPRPGRLPRRRWNGCWPRWGRGFVTTLVTGAGCRPCLTVACRNGQVAEDVYVDGCRFWWGWGSQSRAPGT